MILTIAFQGFPVFRIAGAIKIFEIIAIAIFFIYSPIRFVKDRLGKLLFLFFVVSATLSTVNQFFMEPFPQGFYDRYGSETNTLKFNYYIWPSLQYIFMLVVFRSLYMLYTNNDIYINLETILKKTVYIGTFIAGYSILTLVMHYDIIPELPTFFQTLSDCDNYNIRTRGFYGEPSFYIIYQSWVVLICFYTKKLYSNHKWMFMLTINVICLVLTKSTSLIIFVVIILVLPLLLNNNVSRRLRVFFSVFAIACFVGFLILETNVINLSDLDSMFTSKIEDFLSSDNTDTGSSGAMRNYTSSIGMKIFREHPILGVGCGCSVYYMYLFEYKMGIIRFVETLQAGHRPQNLFSCVLAEQGVIGFTLLIFVWIYILVKMWRHKDIGPYSKMFLMGSVITLGTMFSNNIVYSLYYWIFPILGVGYIRWLKNIKS